MLESPLDPRQAGARCKSSASATLKTLAHAYAMPLVQTHVTVVLPFRYACVLLPDHERDLLCRSRWDVRHMER